MKLSFKISLQLAVLLMGFTAFAENRFVDELFKHFEGPAKAKIGQMVVPFEKSLCLKGFKHSVESIEGIHLVNCTKGGERYTIRINSKNGKVMSYYVALSDDRAAKFKCSDAVAKQFMDKIDKSAVEKYESQYWGAFKGTKAVVICKGQSEKPSTLLMIDYSKQ